jgi:hypothetical protein
MTKRTVTLLALFLLTAPVSSALARESRDPNKIREAFAMSGDTKLQLAAEALGDDQLVNLLDELKNSSKTGDEAVKKVLKKLQ